MKNSYFQSKEKLVDGTTLDLDEVVSNLAFNENGLIPVITQDAESKTVLMFAWMNREALQLTISTGKVTYWSRSRQEFWIKGETSGHTQKLIELYFDCDGDVVLCQVDQTGAACHTMRPNCFYLKVNAEKKLVTIKGNAGVAA